MTTQREQLEALIGHLDHEKSVGLASNIKRLYHEAQNRPPQGDADGSINPDTWKAMGEFADALSHMANKLDRLQKKVMRQIVEDSHRPHPDDPGPDPSTASIDELEEQPNEDAFGE